MSIEIESFIQPEEKEAISLPYAIATRFWVESERAQRRLNELTGRSVSDTPLTILHGRIATSEPLLTQALNEPQKMESVYQQLMAYYISERAEENFPDEQMPGFINPERFTQRLAEELTSIIKPQLGRSVEILLNMVHQANEIAMEYGTTPSMIYLDEALYKEAIRRTYTPQTYTERALELEKLLTVEAIKKSVANALQAALDLGEEEAYEARAFVTALLEAQTTEQQIEIIRLKWLQPYYTIIVEEVIRFWGKDVLTHLPKEVKSKLLDDRPPFPED